MEQLSIINATLDDDDADKLGSSYEAVVEGGIHDTNEANVTSTASSLVDAAGRLVAEILAEKDLLIEKRLDSIFWKLYFFAFRLHLKYLAKAHQDESTFNAIRGSTDKTSFLSNFCQYKDQKEHELVGFCVDKLEFFVLVRCHTALWNVFQLDRSAMKMMTELVSVSNALFSFINRLPVQKVLEFDDVENTGHYVRDYFFWRSMEVQSTFGNYGHALELFKVMMNIFRPSQDATSQLCIEKFTSYMIQNFPFKFSQRLESPSNCISPGFRESRRHSLKLKSLQIVDVVFHFHQLCCRDNLPVYDILDIIVVDKSLILADDKSEDLVENETSQSSQGTPLRKTSRRTTAFVPSSSSSENLLPSLDQIIQNFDVDASAKRLIDAANQFNIYSHALVHDFILSLKNHLQTWLEIVINGCSKSRRGISGSVDAAFLWHPSPSGVSIREALFSLLDQIFLAYDKHVLDKGLHLPELRDLFVLAFYHGYFGLDRTRNFHLFLAIDYILQFEIIEIESYFHLLIAAAARYADLELLEHAYDWLAFLELKFKRKMSDDVSESDFYVLDNVLHGENRDGLLAKMLHRLKVEWEESNRRKKYQDLWKKLFSDSNASKGALEVNVDLSMDNAVASELPVLLEKDLLDFLQNYILPEFPLNLSLFIQFINSPMFGGASESVKSLTLLLVLCLRQNLILWVPYCSSEEVFPMLLTQLLQSYLLELKFAPGYLESELLLERSLENDFISINMKFLYYFISNSSLDSIYRWTDSNAVEIIIKRNSPLFILLSSAYSERVKLLKSHLGSICDSNEAGIVVENLWNFECYASYTLIHFKHVEGVADQVVENFNSLSTNAQKAFQAQLLAIYKSEPTFFELILERRSKTLFREIMASFSLRALIGASTSDLLYPFNRSLTVHEKELFDFYFGLRRGQGDPTSFQLAFQRKIYSKDWRHLSNSKVLATRLREWEILDVLQPKHIKLFRRVSRNSEEFLRTRLSEGDESIIWMRIFTLGRLLKYKNLFWYQLVDLAAALECLVSNYLPDFFNYLFEESTAVTGRENFPQIQLMLVIACSFWIQVLDIMISTQLRDGTFVTAARPQTVNNEYSLFSMLQTTSFLYNLQHQLLNNNSDFEGSLCDLRENGPRFSKLQLNNYVKFLLYITKHPVKYLALGELLMKQFFIPVISSLVKSETLWNDIGDKADAKFVMQLELCRIYYKALKDHPPGSSLGILDSFESLCREIVSSLETSRQLHAVYLTPVIYKLLSRWYKLYRISNGDIRHDLSSVKKMLSLKDEELMDKTSTQPYEPRHYLLMLYDCVEALINADRKRYEHRPAYLLARLSLDLSELFPLESEEYIMKAMKAALPLYNIKATELGHFVLTHHPTSHSSSGATLSSTSLLCKIWKTTTEQHGLHYYYLKKYSIFLIDTLLPALARIQRHKEEAETLRQQAIALICPRGRKKVSALTNYYSSSLVEKYAQ